MPGTNLYIYSITQFFLLTLLNLIMILFFRYLSDKTVVLVTHQIQFIKFVDQIIIMDKGKILAEGCFEDLNVMSF